MHTENKHKRFAPLKTPRYSITIIRPGYYGRYFNFQSHFPLLWKKIENRVDARACTEEARARGLTRLWVPAAGTRNTNKSQRGVMEKTKAVY